VNKNIIIFIMVMISFESFYLNVLE